MNLWPSKFDLTVEADSDILDVIVIDGDGLPPFTAAFRTSTLDELFVVVAGFVNGN